MIGRTMIDGRRFVVGIKKTLFKIMSVVVSSGAMPGHQELIFVTEVGELVELGAATNPPTWFGGKKSSLSAA